MNSRLRSLFIVHISMLVLSLGSSIIYTGIWPYLQRVSQGHKKVHTSIMQWIVYT